MFNSHLILSVEGHFTAANIVSVRKTFEEITLEVDNTLLFDLSKTQHIDSSGIGMLVYIYKRIKRRRRTMVLLGLHGQPQRLCNKLHIGRFIQCMDSQESFFKQQDLS
ncbi:MAG: STAS domain-containing protein [Algicola sp.]|nr:STAS domain-containing protein [Algicola sp.]